MVQQYFVTGWGAMADVPPLVSKVTGEKITSSSASNGNKKKSLIEQQKEAMLESESETSQTSYADEEGPVGSKLRNPNPSSSGSASSTRRSPSQRAASRRRKAPRRYPSRS